MIAVYELRHGYTLANLQHLARIAAATAGTSATDQEDRYDEALGAIAECLYAAEYPPSRPRLVAVGREAIWAAATATLRQHGYDSDRRESAVTSRFVTYWEWAARNTPSPEGPIVERLALAQILPTLTPGQCAAIQALAALDSYAAAAGALGVKYKTFAGTLKEARTRFLARWHEGEEPSRQWMTDHRNGGEEARSARRALTRLRRRTGSRVNQPPSPDLLPVDIGARIGSLTVLEGRRRGAIKILCRCDCGTEREFIIANLRRGASQSCGCPEGRRAVADRKRAALGGTVTVGRGAYPRTRAATKAADRRAMESPPEGEETPIHA